MGDPGQADADFGLFALVAGCSIATREPAIAAVCALPCTSAQTYALLLPIVLQVPGVARWSSAAAAPRPVASRQEGASPRIPCSLFGWVPNFILLHTGNGNGDVDTPTGRDMAESKLNAFGLPVPRSMLMQRQRSGQLPQRGGRPPLAPTSPEPPSSATSSQRSLNVGQGAWSTQAEPCTSGYETPTQASLPHLHALHLLRPHVLQVPCHHHVPSGRPGPLRGLRQSPISGCKTPTQASICLYVSLWHIIKLTEMPVRALIIRALNSKL